MALIDDVKVSLRIKSTVLDSSEIQPIIEACKADLKLSGVNKIEESDPLVQRAAVLYAKANFGYGEDSEKFMRAYEALKKALTLSGDYNGGGTNAVQ